MLGSYLSSNVLEKSCTSKVLLPVVELSWKLLYFLWNLTPNVMFPLDIVGLCGWETHQWHPEPPRSTAQKVSVFGVILARIFPHSNWIRRDKEYLSVFSPNAEK